MYPASLIPVNDVLPNTISSITAADLPPDNVYIDRHSRNKLYTYEATINKLGILSARAQGLKRPITAIEKVRRFSDHKLYILKDEQANGGSGQAIGVLNVAPKKLYLYDEHNNLTEATPLCVLDFFILEGFQRAGWGKRLFDSMLEEQKLRAHELAVDGPTAPMLNFLKKHYGFDEVVKQANNFAVSKMFFSDIESIREKNGHRVVQQPQVPRRNTWYSEVGKIIHGGGSSSSTD